MSRIFATVETAVRYHLDKYCGHIFSSKTWISQNNVAFANLAKYMYYLPVVCDNRALIIVMDNSFTLWRKNSIIITKMETK